RWTGFAFLAFFSFRPLGTFFAFLAFGPLSTFFAFRTSRAGFAFGTFFTFFSFRTGWTRFTFFTFGTGGTRFLDAELRCQDVPIQRRVADPRLVLGGLGCAARGGLVG